MASLGIFNNEAPLKNNVLHYNRWNARRHELVFKQDIRELADIKLLTDLEHLTRILPERVGSPLSVNNLREIVGVAYDTCVLWLEWLDRVYHSFRIEPFTDNIARSLMKEKKLLPF